MREACAGPLLMAAPSWTPALGSHTPDLPASPHTPSLGLHSRSPGRWSEVSPAHHHPGLGVWRQRSACQPCRVGPALLGVRQGTAGS